MIPQPPIEWLTVNDLLRAGACQEGVDEWRRRHAPTATAVQTSHAIRVTMHQDELLRLESASGRQGWGTIEGSRSTVGDGQAAGNSFGFGSEIPDADGFGTCYGDCDSFDLGGGGGESGGYAYVEDVFGDGFGDGGYGGGFGDGFGDGDGYGDGDHKGGT